MNRRGFLAGILGLPALAWLASRLERPAPATPIAESEVPEIPEQSSTSNPTIASIWGTTDTAGSSIVTVYPDGTVLWIDKP